MEVYEAAHGAAAQLNQKQADAEPVPLRVSLRASAPKSDADGICARRAVSPMCKFRCTGGGEPKLDEEEPMGIVEADGVLWKATRPHQFRPVPQEIQSCWDLLVERCRSTPKGIAAGNRPVLERSMEGKFEKLVLGSYVWSNYATYLARAEAIAAGRCSQAACSRGRMLRGRMLTGACARGPLVQTSVSGAAISLACSSNEPSAAIRASACRRLALASSTSAVVAVGNRALSCASR